MQNEINWVRWEPQVEKLGYYQRWKHGQVGSSLLHGGQQHSLLCSTEDFEGKCKSPLSSNWFSFSLSCLFLELNSGDSKRVLLTCWLGMLYFQLYFPSLRSQNLDRFWGVLIHTWQVGWPFTMWIESNYMGFRIKWKLFCAAFLAHTGFYSKLTTEVEMILSYSYLLLKRFS